MMTDAEWAEYCKYVGPIRREWPNRHKLHREWFCSKSEAEDALKMSRELLRKTIQEYRQAKWLRGAYPPSRKLKGV
jgi:hypothetical protein